MATTQVHKNLWELFSSWHASWSVLLYGLFSFTPAMGNFGWNNVWVGTKIVHGKLQGRTRPPIPLKQDGHTNIEWDFAHGSTINFDISDFTSETWGFPLKFKIEDSHLELKKLVFSNAEIRSLFPLCQFKHVKNRLFGRLLLVWIAVLFALLQT